MDYYGYADGDGVVANIKGERYDERDDDLCCCCFFSCCLFYDDGNEDKDSFYYYDCILCCCFVLILLPPFYYFKETNSISYTQRMYLPVENNELSNYFIRNVSIRE